MSSRTRTKRAWRRAAPPMFLWLCLLCAGAMFGTPSCGGTADDLCTAICECVGCGDRDQDEQCAEVEGSADVAEAYGCDAEWEDAANCLLDKGECDDDTQRFSARAPGSCSGTYDTGFMCVDDIDCGGAPNTCNGTCQQRGCSDGSQPCSDDAQCPAGEDRCADEMLKLFECADDASDDPLLVQGMLQLLGGGIPPTTSVTTTTSQEVSAGPTGPTTVGIGGAGASPATTVTGGMGGVGGAGGAGGN